MFSNTHLRGVYRLPIIIIYLHSLLIFYRKDERLVCVLRGDLEGITSNVNQAFDLQLLSADNYFMVLFV